MRLLLTACAFLIAVCLPVAAARAELYQWVDADGRMHFTDDATQVPARHRADARRETGADGNPETRNWNTVEIVAPTRTQTRAPAARSRSGGSGSGRTHVIGVERGASEIKLIGTLDGHVDANFIADTGATLNTMPFFVAAELGIEVGSDTPTISLVGVGGHAMLAPLVRVESVQVGSAVVRNVEFALLATMRTGLLGMPFFNNFKVELDPSVGTLKLTEIDLSSVEGLYGGKGEASWRRRYRQIRERQERIEEIREKLPSEFETMAEGRLQHLEQAEAQLEEQLDRLDDEAVRAGVPGSWRE